MRVKSSPCQRGLGYFSASPFIITIKLIRTDKVQGAILYWRCLTVQRCTLPKAGHICRKTLTLYYVRHAKAVGILALRPPSDWPLNCCASIVGSPRIAPQLRSSVPINSTTLGGTKYARFYTINSTTENSSRSIYETLMADPASLTLGIAGLGGLFATCLQLY